MSVLEKRVSPQRIIYNEIKRLRFFFTSSNERNEQRYKLNLEMWIAPVLCFRKFSIHFAILTTNCVLWERKTSTLGPTDKE